VIGASTRDRIDIVVEGDSHRASSVYETEPVGGVAQDDYWNMVIELTTDASARELLVAPVAPRRRADESARFDGVREPSTSTCCSWVTNVVTTRDRGAASANVRAVLRSGPVARVGAGVGHSSAVGAGAGAVSRLGTLESLR